MKTSIAFLLAVSMIGLSGCATVGPGNRGVKVSMGQVDKHLYQPGILSYNPLTDHIQHMNIQQQTVEGESSPLTSDQQQISIKYRVQFRCPENQLLNLYQNYQGNPYDSLVNPQVQEAIRQVVANHKAEQVTKELTTIKNQVLTQVRENTKGLVDVVDIPITHVDLPKILQDAIAAKQVIEQQALQKQYELDKARKEAEITVVNAQAAAQQKVLNAKAEAESIKVQSDALAKNPVLIEYKKAEKWNGKLPDTVLGSSGTLFNLK